MNRDERRLRAGLAANAGWRAGLELALPPRLFYTIVASFLGNEHAGPGERELFDAAAPVLRDAIHQGLGPRFMVAGRGGWTPLTLLGAVNVHLLMPFEKLGRATVISAVTHFVTALDADGIVLLPTGGPVRGALEKVVDVLNEYPDIAEGVDRSGRKNARRMLAACRDLGFYPAVAGEVAA
ncbi:hypothetical protein [Niveispirillum sp.]|uniref:hypothetical protein n=1 Tax=Niveispirillum sp. TaxID=1917217 RepID=UPI001B63162C|nr:hypothetical protein [Niveispirillum sp.]MBP7336886.1 hypothetical protein [Niveispirillum sp.]